MPPRFEEEEEFLEDYFEDSDQSVDDEEREEEDSRECPKCKSSIYGDSVRCPRCGHWLEDEFQAPGRKPWWMIILAVLVLFTLIGWAFGGF